MPFMVMNQPIHQDIITANLNQITSNPGPLLTKPVLWFHISSGDLIIIPLIMVILRFTLQSFHLNLTLNLFHIQTPLWSNQLVIMRWTILCNYSTKNTMVIFWMLTSRWLSINWWSPLLQIFIQSLLYFFIYMDEQMFQSQISCHTFLYLSQPSPLWNWLM